MEKEFIEQLLNSNISLKRIKSIIEKAETKKEEHNLNETTTANTCGLRILTCQGCHKSMFEDKFMLNKTNKRYRSCINCVMRARQSRTISKKTNMNNNNNNNVLAILDTEYNEEKDNNDNDTNNNIYPFPYPIEKKEDIIIKPSNDKPNENLMRPKAKKIIISNEHYRLAEPETEPEELSLRFFNLFNSK